MELEIPVLQGGMGVGVSLSGLAGAVSLAGGLGVISAAQIGFRNPNFAKSPIDTNLSVLKEEILKAKKISQGKPVGVNIMVVTRRYEDYVKAAVEAGADVIVSGAGLPMDLPRLTVGYPVLLAPIVSGKRALQVLLAYWKKHYNRKPDLVIVEGPKAGGHLGFSREELETVDGAEFDRRVSEILEITKKEAIPVFVGGGVYERKDLDHYRKLGADGVQIATRFVTTFECDAHENYKMAYIEAKEEDVVIVKSPVGMPGRAIRNAFLERVEKGERFLEDGCKQCITTCNPKETPYCITKALINAVNGKVEEGLLFCGSNVYRANRMESVSQIMEEFRI